VNTRPRLPRSSTHQLVRVQRAAEAGLRVGGGGIRREPVGSRSCPPTSRSGRHAAARYTAASRAPARCSPDRGSGRVRRPLRLASARPLPAREETASSPPCHLDGWPPVERTERPGRPVAAGAAPRAARSRAAPTVFSGTIEHAGGRQSAAHTCARRLQRGLPPGRLELVAAAWIRASGVIASPVSISRISDPR